MSVFPQALVGPFRMIVSHEGADGCSEMRLAERHDVGDDVLKHERALRPQERERLGDQPGAYASARYVRITPMKARRVVNLVRGMPVDDALALLQFAPQAAAEGYDLFLTGEPQRLMQGFLDRKK